MKMGRGKELETIDKKAKNKEDKDIDINKYEEEQMMVNTITEDFYLTSLPSIHSKVELQNVLCMSLIESISTLPQIYLVNL